MARNATKRGDKDVIKGRWPTVQCDRRGAGKGVKDGMGALGPWPLFIMPAEPTKRCLRPQLFRKRSGEERWGLTRGGWKEVRGHPRLRRALTLGGRGVVHYPARVETVHRGLPALKPSMSAAAGASALGWSR
jgi:hypothetical protein